MSSSSPSCAVTVLVLATCHSFPGPSSLSLLTERTGCTIRFYSPDCSPSTTSFTSTSTSTSISSSSTSSSNEANVHSDSSTFKKYTYSKDSCQLMENGTENENENDKLSQYNQCEIERIPLTESKMFELSPINFINEKNSFWEEWGTKADFILTFDSYLISLNETLIDRGFIEVLIMIHEIILN